MALPYGILADRVGERLTFMVMGLVVMALSIYFSLQLFRVGAIGSRRGQG